MLIGSPYSRPQEIDLQLDLINHRWDGFAGPEFLRKQSALARETLDCVEDIRIGARREERVDVYRAPGPNAPILVFVHGGWWRGGTRKEWGYVANGFVRRGYTVVVSDYALCPKVTIPDITQATRAAIVWAYENAGQINGNRDRLFVTGHSAGGQQAGMMAVTDWTLCGIPADALKGVVPISGIFDMRPLQSCWLQPFIQLTGDTALSESPVFNIPAAPPPVLVMLGDEEATEFHRQASLFADALRDKCHRAEYLAVVNEDHASNIFRLADPSSPTTTAIAEFFARC